METVNFVIYVSSVTLNLSSCIVAIYINWKTYGTDYDREYKKLIFVQFSFGFLSGIINGISRCEIVLYRNYLIFHYGYFSCYQQSLILYKITFGLYLLITDIDIAFPSVVLLSRYIICCKSAHLTLKKVILLTFVPISLSLITFYNGYMINHKITPVSVVINLLKDSPSGEHLVNLKTTTTFFVFVKYIICITIITSYFISNYIIIFIFYFKYKKYMEVTSPIMSERTKKMQKEFSKIILFQSLAPVGLCSIPILSYIGFFFFNSEFSKPFYGTTILQVLSLVPSVNALLFIFMSSKNREVLLRLFNIIIIYYDCKNKFNNNNTFGIWKFLKKKFRRCIKKISFKKFSTNIEHINE
uniref:G_PROTEIN_RECEP_F1_2 domain-containing protein n=1 Tax=Strongyloides papillosus TaxID=174720 RepID=A0A0N5C105_STREA